MLATPTPGLTGSRTLQLPLLLELLCFREKNMEFAIRFKSWLCYVTLQLSKSVSLKMGMIILVSSVLGMRAIMYVKVVCDTL